MKPNRKPIILIFLLFLVPTAHAGILDELLGITELQTPDPIIKFIENLTGIVLGIIGLLSILFLIIGGYQYITAAGSPEKIQKAKSTILYSIIGLVVALLAGSITGFVQPIVSGWTSSFQPQTIITSIIQTTLLFFAGLAVLFIVVGAYQYITSAGNPEQIEKAKKTLSGAIAGSLIVLLSRAIVDLVQNQIQGNPPLEGVLEGFIKTAIEFVGTVALLTLVVGGYQFITSAGNPDALGKAKKTIYYSLMGLVIAILSFAIFNFVVGIFK